MSRRKSSDEQQRVKFEGQEPTFYAMIPKMAIMDLTPYELALYCNYKQTASDGGACTKSTATLAKETQMSISKVKLVRNGLADKGFIKVEHHKDGDIENQTLTVTIVNVWAKNHERYSKDASQPATTPSHVVTTPQSQSNGEGVTTKPQRITIQEEPDKKEKIAPAIPDLKVLPKPERKRLRAWVQHSERYADGALIDVTAPTFEDACNDLFYTWLDGLDRAGCKPDTDIEELWSMSRVYAVSLTKNRRTVEQVAAYIDWIYSPTNPDKFYREPLKVLRLAAVSNSIGAWLKEKEKKSVRAAAPITPSAPVVELTPAEIEQRRREVEEARKSFARGA